MLEKVTARLRQWAQKWKTPPVVTEDTPLKELALTYPHLWLFLESRYQLPQGKLDSAQSLKQLSQQFDLPPAQIIFMELQLEKLKRRVEEISAIEAQKLIHDEPELTLLDVREKWEYHFGSLKNSIPFSPEFLEDLLKSENKDRPILLYCHFGIRSLDAAHHLAEKGFRRIYVIVGGIDAWSQQVEHSIPRYTGAYC